MNRDAVDGVLQAALRSAGIGTWRWDATTGVVAWDSTLEELSGFAPGTFPGTFDAWLATLHPDERDAVAAAVREALGLRAAYHVEHRTIWPDGTVRWLHCRGEVTVDEAGEPTGTIGCAIDVTDRKTAEASQAALFEELRDAAERVHRLQLLSSRLTNALTVDEVVAGVLDHLDAPVGASARAMWLRADHSDLVLVAQAGMKPEAAERFAVIDADSSLPGAVAVRERRTVLSTTTADTTERFPELHDAPRSADGFVAVPIVTEEDALGVLAFGFDGALDDSDVVFLEAAAGYVGQTLQRVRLDEALERRATDAAFLAELAHAAVRADDHRELMRNVGRAVVPRLGTWVSVHFVPEAGGAMETVVVHDDPQPWSGTGSGREQLPPDPIHRRGVATVLRSGRTELLADVEQIVAAAVTEPETDAAAIHQLVQRPGVHSVVTVPIATKRRVIGALQAVRAGTDRAHDADDVTLAETAAARIGDALENRWLTDQHRHISASLQRAFLPPVLPRVEGLDIAAAYWPAGIASDVGGDFYDVFRIGDTRWALIIGDACGTGPDAAAVAAIARHTTRAAARHGFDHRDVIEWVNQAICHSDRDLFATVCYATVDLAPNRCTIRLAAAGHPLPIVVDAAGARAVGRPGTLLGVFDDVDVFVEEAELGPEDAVVFWTDGVTDLPPPYGRTAADLVDLLARERGHSADDIVATIGAELDGRVANVLREDDVALLVLRRTVSARRDRIVGPTAGGPARPR